MLATGAYLCLEVSQVLDDGALQDKGLQLIAQAYRDCWDEAQGLYRWSRVIDWPQSTMMMALASAYRITGEQRFVERAERVVASVETILRWILSTDLYHPDEHLLFHHGESESSATPGRADYFCTGCNFETLAKIYRFNQFVEPATPAR